MKSPDIERLESELRSVLKALKIARRERDDAKKENVVLESRLATAQSMVSAARLECEEAKARRDICDIRDICDMALKATEEYMDKRDEAQEELRRVEANEMSGALQRVNDELRAAVHKLQKVETELQTVRQERDIANDRYKSAIAAWAGLERAALTPALNGHAV